MNQADPSPSNSPSDAFYAAALPRIRNFMLVLAPVLTVVPRKTNAVSLPQAALITSGNAISALPAALHDVPLLAVGDATAERARRAGFARVHSAGRDAAALADLAAAILTPAAGPLLLASGDRLRIPSNAATLKVVLAVLREPA